MVKRTYIVNFGNKSKAITAIRRSIFILFVEFEDKKSVKTPGPGFEPRLGESKSPVLTVTQPGNFTAAYILANPTENTR